MAEYTFAELKKKNVSQLRAIAKEVGIDGSSQMNKEHVLEKICQTLHIDMHVHHEVVGVDKAAIKKQIRELKKERDQYLQDKKPEELRRVRRRIKKLKNKLRSATV
ncbi:MAG TPA: hypothetical protein ENK44_13395 [Caldithrix abyssi]|uniref:Rho termination factor-like N-terminal domain-containing protein n=1 Tax=Caldithrix abyssi TaxID=187145 RepID=A0A7V4U261_CALAY|nr:hypothetical protein [Caldithrix abyssi]